MASPQAENGHIDIANEIAEYLARIRISGEEWQILWVILRKTWGWKKKKDWISLAQFCETTQLSKPAVCRALNKLRLKKIVFSEKSGTKTSYSLNKDHETWSSELLKYDREKIFERDGFLCAMCGEKFDKRNLNVHHIKALVECGSNKQENLITLCESCNKRHGMAISGINQKVTVTNLLPYQKSYGNKLVDQGGNNIDNPGVTKLLHTKETNTKETNTKETNKDSVGSQGSPTATQKKNLSSHQSLMELYFRLFQDKFMEKPLITQKEGAIIKRLLGTYPVEKLEELLQAFFLSEDQFILQSGYTMGVFSSQINKLISAKNPTKVAGKDYPKGWDALQRLREQEGRG